jgi:hypothetical protein
MTHILVRNKPRRRSAASAAGLSLARGEDHRTYQALHQAISSDISPCDTIETALTQTIIDEIWETPRCRMIEACLLAGHRPEGGSLTATAVPARTSQPGVLRNGQGTVLRRSRRTTPSDADRAATRTTLLATNQYGQRIRA